MSNVEQTVSVDLKQLEEKYACSSLIEKMQWHINLAIKENWPYKIEILEETKRFVTIAFATNSFSYFYEVSKNRREIFSENRVAIFEAEKLMKLMNGLK
jgi:RAB protein geranylgeranyltransferase component A